MKFPKDERALEDFKRAARLGGTFAKKQLQLLVTDYLWNTCASFLSCLYSHDQFCVVLKVSKSKSVSLKEGPPLAACLL